MHKTGSTLLIATSLEEDRATATSNMWREIWTCGFWDMPMDRQTDKHTDTLIAILRPPTETK